MVMLSRHVRSSALQGIMLCVSVCVCTDGLGRLPLTQIATLTPVIEI